jgi:transposase-like protein
VDVPRDHEGSFEPQSVRKRERRLTGFDDRILALCTRGVSVRGIKGHLQEEYGVDVSPDLISWVAGAVMADVAVAEPPARLGLPRRLPRCDRREGS